MEATRRLVAQMANGGIEPAQGCMTLEQETELILAAQELVTAAHADADGKVFIKRYDVAKQLKSIPGVYKSSAGGGGKKSKADNLDNAISLWPHLIRKNDARLGYDLLKLNFRLFEEVFSEESYAPFGGGFKYWRPVWECKSEVAIDTQSIFCTCLTHPIRYNHTISI